MKIIFFGTPEYVIPVLDALYKSFRTRNEHPIAAVVTQSPKPVGRAKQVEYSAVDHWAHKKNIPIYFDAKELIHDRIEADLGIVASYGAIIPEEVLSYFPQGLLNIHPSNLPEFRGASPIHAMLVTGKKEAVVSIMKIDEKMDHGPLVTQFKEDIEENDTVETLRTRLFEHAAEVLVGLIPAYMSGKVQVKEQDHEKAVYTKILKKEDGFIPYEILTSLVQPVIASKAGDSAPSLRGDESDAAISIKNTTSSSPSFRAKRGNLLEEDSPWQIPFIYTKTSDGTKVPYSLVPSAESLFRFIRTMNPWPGAWTIIKSTNKEKRLKILEAHVESTVIANEARQSLIIDTVQLEGKNPVPWKLFREAYKDYLH